MYNFGEGGVGILRWEQHIDTNKGLIGGVWTQFRNGAIKYYSSAVFSA